MPFITSTIAALGVAGTISTATAVAGIGISVKGSMDAAEASKQVAQSSAAAESVRKEQARVTAIREQRKIFQEAQRARAASISTAAAQGATYSSAAEGGLATISGASGAQTSALNENVDLGSALFDANAANAYARSDVATASGISDIGKSLFSSAEKLGSIGSSLYGPDKNTVKI